MNIISDEILHLFLRNAELLKKEIRLEIENKLKTDIPLSKRLEEIKLFYNVYDNLNIGREVLFKCNFTNDIIPLYPFKTEEILCVNWTKHAALHEIAEQNNYTRYLTFISYENNVIIRVHSGENENEYKLFLIMEEEEKIKNAVVMIDKYDEEFIPDDNGIVLVKGIYIDESTILSVKFKE